MASPIEIQRIAAAMHAIRPDWRQDSLVTYLTTRFVGRAYHDLAIAAVAVALDSKTTTPALLAQHGPWWSAAYVASGQGTEAVGPGREPACDVEGHEHELKRLCRACRADAIAAEDRCEDCNIQAGGRRFAGCSFGTGIVGVA